MKLASHDYLLWLLIERLAIKKSQQYSIKNSDTIIELRLHKGFPEGGVKEWRDLENQVRGRSRSLKMAPFDKKYATF